MQVLMDCCHLPVVNAHSSPITHVLVCECELWVGPHGPHNPELPLVPAGMFVNEVLDLWQPTAARNRWQGDQDAAAAQVSMQHLPALSGKSRLSWVL